MRISNAQALAVVVLAIAGMVPLSAARAAQPDDKAVPQATAQFYAALNTMFTGNVEPMNAVWSHTEDTTYMGPDGKFIVGWDQISGNWQHQADLKLGGKVEPEAMHVTIGQDLAVVQCLEVGENIVKGKPQTVSLRATNIFRKHDGQWKMIGHHTDLLPFLAQ